MTNIVDKIVENMLIISQTNARQLSDSPEMTLDEINAEDCRDQKGVAHYFLA